MRAADSLKEVEVVQPAECPRDNERQSRVRSQQL